ncbi:hypothetical protein K1F50_07005 [Muricauda oceani]|uniref:Uncharacterized protein n=1 Tax=Flagellimonas oceani TaxID=2698672 RepID=A0A6G7J644_9FLAO|nr:hypothetical protein [Allomuricauda oceani]MBW8242546.1 hypothetical protein [Allomuricauda oceani]QII46305.1 hypothetical protein GVT53_16990 [Allomuricauda oceani]
MKTTEYYLKARLFPTIICAIPILTLYYFGFSGKVIDFIDFLKGYKWVSDITISIAIIYLMTQINRFVSKELFQKVFFKDELNMPTTNFLLHSGTFFAERTKINIREKVKEKFDIELFTKSEEDKNELEARKTIVSAVAQVRNATRDNHLLLQHNIEYGFTRNLIGGCLIAVLISLLNLYFFKSVIPNLLAFNISIGFAILYALPILFSKYLINRYGKYYAKVLFEQFLQN